MSLTLNVSGQDAAFESGQVEKYSYQLAAAPDQDTCYKIGTPITTSWALVLNELTAQVIKTDDKDLITLFRRAVRNHDALFPDNQVEPVPLYNKHYKEPSFYISKTDLTLDVQEDYVQVTTELKIRRNSFENWLILDAKQHKVLSVFVDGVERKDFQATEHEIIVMSSPMDGFDVRIVSQINPFKNDSGQGLYKCGEWLTTQCESEGARCIFPTLDRPDVLSVYTTTIIADTAKYPYRISNGNLISETTGEDGRAIIKWEDPFPKPSYLFATVLGDFGVLKDNFITRSGRNVTIEVFMEKGKEKRAEFSLLALKKAMQYEEEFFDREYDLDSLKMVAMPKFNAGAMENKGLIIFNESAILVDPTCASDLDYFWVALVISHEYCHNWSGNRVTVRNWFELALKEAFTDFRCCKFMEWFYGADLSRPREAKSIRERQFPQDAGPAAHPIQVESYITSDEVYDNTTYVKGREVFRMLQTILDSKRENGFRVAQNVYFARYDGQAVTFNELLDTLQHVSDVDLTQFKRWFHQSGTPTVQAKTYYDADTKTLSVSLAQSCQHPQTKEKQLPFHIPLYFELLDQNGNVIVPKGLVEFIEENMVISFDGIESQPIPVFHHDFSAPIRMEYSYTNEELQVIMQHEKDAFARKEASDIYLRRELQRVFESAKSSEGKIPQVPQKMIDFYFQSLASDSMSPLAKAWLFDLPTIRSLVEKEETFDFAAAKCAQETVKKQIAKGLEKMFLRALVQYSDPENYEPDSLNFKDEIAIRKLRNICYDYLSLAEGGRFNDMIIEAYQKAKNFNNQFELLNVIVELDDPRRDDLLKAFYETWKNDSTILCNWIDIQTGASNCTVEILNKIFNTEGFKKDNPDHMRSLIRNFVNNLATFHGNAEANYPYVTDHILEFAKINPKVAAGYLAEDAFQDYAKLPPHLKELMKAQLSRIADPSNCLELRAVAKTYL